VSNISRKLRSIRALSKKNESGVSLKQDNRALHKFADTLYAYSQRNGDFPVSVALCPQRYTLALFWCELRQAPHALFEKDLLFRARCRIYSFPNDGVGFVVVAPGPTSLSAVDIHRKVVGNTEYPRTKVIFLTGINATTD
jgi:hypothetical protein